MKSFGAEVVPVDSGSKTLVDAVRKRDEIALKSLEYLKEKTKNLSF